MQYKCEYCGGSYNTAEECKKCEEFHVQPDGLHAGTFKPVTQTDNKYLDRIVILMKDGVLAQYAFEGIIDQSLHVDQNPDLKDNGTEDKQ